jgi:hypothetical protein
MTIAPTAIALQNVEVNQQDKNEVEAFACMSAEELCQEFTMLCRFGELTDLELMLKQNFLVIENFIVKGNGKRFLLALFA